MGFAGPLTGSDRGQAHCQLYLKKHPLTPFNGPHLARAPSATPPPPAPVPLRYSRHSRCIPPCFLNTELPGWSTAAVYFLRARRGSELEVFLTKVEWDAGVGEDRLQLSIFSRPAWCCQRDQEVSLLLMRFRQFHACTNTVFGNFRLPPSDVGIKTHASGAIIIAHRLPVGKW